jgi:hypothetical protein
VALISGGAPADCDIPQLTLGRFGPLRTIHAIETEMHVRPIDALVPVGRRAELALRLVPASFKPRIEGLSLEREPPSLDLAGVEPNPPGRSSP